MKVMEVTTKEFNNIVTVRNDLLWKRQNKEPYFYISHKTNKVGILIVSSETVRASGILYKSTNVNEDERTGYIPQDVLEQGNIAIATFIAKNEVKLLKE